MGKKRSKQKTTTTLIVEENDLAKGTEENQAFEDLSSELAEIRKMKGVMGYIIRNENSAIIDLEAPDKLGEYAILSYEILDSSLSISDLFELGDFKSVLVEGEENNVLCMKIEGNKVGLFLEKGADCAAILKLVSP